MSWVTTAVLGGAGLGLNYLSGKAKQNQDIAGMQANAEQIRYSPWTGMKSQVRGPQSGSPLLEGLKGGAQGALAGHMFGSQFSSAPEAMAAPAPQAATGGLGSTDYAQALGNQATAFQNSMAPQLQAPQMAGMKKPNLYNPWG